MASYNTSITFSNKDIGWLFTKYTKNGNRYNNLYKTSDGGQNWQKIRTINKNGSFTTAVFSRESDFFYMINSDYSLSIGYDARFTSNGGITWDSTQITNEEFGILHFFDDKKGIAMSMEHCWTTADGGLTWNKKGKIPLSKDIFFYNEKLGWAVGYSPFSEDAGYIAKTTDGGISWKYQDSTTFNQVDYFGVEFIDSLKGFAIGGSLNKTTDGGNNWLHNLYPDMGGFDIGFLDQKNGWISSSKQILRTINGGETWELQFESTNLFVFRKLIILKEDKMAYALGVNPGDNTATLLKADLSGISGVDEKKEAIPEEFYLLQNYPNPFNPTTIIEYRIPKEGLVILKVYDLLGKDITTLVNERKVPGTYKINFDGSRLTSGVYITRLTTGKLSESIKLILLK